MQRMTWADANRALLYAGETPDNANIALASAHRFGSFNSAVAFTTYDPATDSYTVRETR